MLTARQAALIPRIYDAAASEAAWPSALDAVAEGGGARGSTLFALDTVGLPFAIQKFSSLYKEEDVLFFLENFSRYEAEGWERIRSEPTQRFIMDQDVWPNVDELNHRPDYVWLLDKAGVGRRSAARLNNTQGWIDSVALQYDASIERVPNSVTRQADAMLPHLAKAVELNRSFSLLRSRFHAVLNALDRVKIGVCVTSHHGNAIIVNEEAQRIFDLRDGLTLGQNMHFRCTSGDTTAALAMAIGNAARTVKGEGNTHETLMAVPRRSGVHPFLVEVAPLSDGDGELEPRFKGAILFIVDPENPRPFSITKAARCFSFTEAESMVCMFMVQGLTDTEIAAQRSVSVDTVKSQVKAIFRKTNTAKRAELIRIVLSITPPIEMP